jgi:hypothetical protein
LVVGKADDGDRLLGFRFFVHPRDPAIQASLETIGFEPTVSVGSHPRRSGPGSLRKVLLEPGDLSTELGGECASFPLLLSHHVAVDPEAPRAAGGEINRGVVLGIQRQIDGPP